MIQIHKTSDLNVQTINEVKMLIEKEFGHIPIVQETTWAIPNWTIIFYEDNEIATFYNIVERTISIDNNNYFSAGINNVITPAKHRGKGLSTQTLKSTEDFLFNELKADLGLLLCADNLLPFYERLEWYKVDCPVYFDQPSGKRLWTANTMLRTKNRVIQPGQIDLNGLPW